MTTLTDLFVGVAVVVAGQAANRLILAGTHVKTECRSHMQQIHDGAEAFSVTVIDATQTPERVAMFAVGRGGNPLRHLPLLTSVASLGCRVVAPHFDILASPIPSKAELDTRIRRLRASADEYCKGCLPIVGIGHSIGTVALLALAGGEAQTFSGEQAISGSQVKFTRLALCAPPADFFRKPGALERVRVPIRIWVGARDSITPPAQAQFLQDALKSHVPIEICLDEEAGHFSYMDELPPSVTDPHPDRSTFLASLANDVGQFVIT